MCSNVEISNVLQYDILFYIFILVAWRNLIFKVARVLLTSTAAMWVMPRDDRRKFVYTVNNSDCGHVPEHDARWLLCPSAQGTSYTEDVRANSLLSPPGRVNERGRGRGYRRRVRGNVKTVNYFPEEGSPRAKEVFIYQDVFIARARARAHATPRASV